MQTITHKEIHNWWDGLVIIDEIKEYVDERGSLVELWRTDDDKTIKVNENSSITSPQMSYWSITKPFVQRGPHQHLYQFDFFVTWKSTMVYQLYNPNTNEMKYFITDPNKVTRVKVATPIIHSYRNLDGKDSITGNFPTSLFMGMDKKEPIDEIRHEELIKPSKNIWIFGANGRLGKAIVKKLYDDMNYHTYNVIPITEKFANDENGIQKLNNILNLANNTKISPDDVIINCLGKTNVQNSSDDFIFSNFSIPKYITEFCISNKFYFVHFSTDYVYQVGELSKYTQSKLMFEQWLDASNEEPTLQNVPYEDIHTYAKIIRVANLFSQDVNDEHNALFKLYKAAMSNKLTISKGHIIMPTDVADIATFISNEYIHKINNFDSAINISGKSYTTEQIIQDFAGLGECWQYIDSSKNPVKNFPDIFLNMKNYIQLNCDEAIKKKLLSLHK